MSQLILDLYIFIDLEANMLPMAEVLLLERTKYPKDSSKCYKNAFGEEYYGEFGECLDDFCMVANIISPALLYYYKKSRIKYKDAKEIEEFIKEESIKTKRCKELKKKITKLVNIYGI